MALSGDRDLIVVYCSNEKNDASGEAHIVHKMDGLW